MKIIQNIKVPTGNIFVAEGQKGKIEFLSLGDYGQNVNLNQHKPVPDGLPIMPLTEKWVVTISTQYGCSMNCTFCDVPKVGMGTNATFDDMKNMITLAITQPNVPDHTKRLNIHFARMGEPSWNDSVIDCAYWIYDALHKNYNPHPVISTMMPKNNKHLKYFIQKWMQIKNNIFKGNAGLQISVNSTDEKERDIMFSGNALDLENISHITNMIKPIGRKITLNFAVANYTVDPKVLLKYFSPENYIIKLTPMHKTKTAIESDIKTKGDYTTYEPYEELENNIKKAGYDVLVFIASKDEDEGRITCGNAILSGTMPFDIK